MKYQTRFSIEKKIRKYFKMSSAGILTKHASVKRIRKDLF